jgi:hypothetical protein
MISLFVEQASVDETVDHLQMVRERIFANIREVMEAGAPELAQMTVEAAAEEGIEERTGKYFASILASAMAYDNDVEIGAQVTTDSSMGQKGKHIGIWLMAGFHEKAMKLSDTGQRRKYNKYSKAGESFADSYLHRAFGFQADGTLVWAAGHAAFSVRSRPFAREAQERWYPPLVEKMQEAIAAAAAGGNV